MTLEQLKQFLYAAKYESFTVASEHLYTHPSTVSRNVSLLERDIGFTLFERTNRGIYLNDAGRFFMKEVDIILNMLNEALAQARNIGKRTTEKLVVRLGENMYTCVAKLFVNFLKEYPTALIDLGYYSYSKSLDVCRQLDERNIDLYFGYRDNIPSSSVSAWNLRKVYSDYIGVTVGEGHRLAKNSSISLKDLQNEYLLGSNFHDYELEHSIISAMKEAGYKSMRPIHGLAYNDMFMRVSAGLGVSFVAASTTSAASWACKTIPLADFEYEKPLYMIWRGDNNNPTLQQFLETSSRILAG